MPISNQPRNREGQAAAERVLREIESRNGPFVAAVQATRVPMVVTDPQIAGNPIIYAYNAFVRMCGTSRTTCSGRTTSSLSASTAARGWQGVWRWP